jgi:BON domain-containing protein
MQDLSVGTGDLDAYGEAFVITAVITRRPSTTVKTGYSRGQVDNADQVRALVEAASRVDGVTAVENLLHLRGGTARTNGGDRRAVA